MNWVEAPIAVGAFLLSVLSWWAATRARSQSNRLEGIKVSVDAYEKAQAIGDRAIEQLTKRNDRLAAELDQCMSRVDQLERALREAGIPVPLVLVAVKGQ